jgi:hypothetical protein
MKSLKRLERDSSLAKKGIKPLQLEKQKDYDMEIDKRKIEKSKLQLEANLFTIQVPSKTLGQWGIKVIKVNSRVALFRSWNFNQWL